VRLSETCATHGLHVHGYDTTREPRRCPMNDSGWAGVLMGTLAILIAIGFVTMWVRDRGRAQEQATDSERTHTDAHPGAQSREGAAEEPHDIPRERRH
jgi:hypothetical protein